MRRRREKRSLNTPMPWVYEPTSTSASSSSLVTAADGDKVFQLPKFARPARPIRVQP